MNRESAKKLWAVIKAYGEGEKIQLKRATGKWEDIADPDFIQGLEYRIKPKPFECWVTGDTVRATVHFVKPDSWFGAIFHMREVEE